MPVRKKAVRLHKILADAGLFSRRAAERAMEEGRVAVNGEIVSREGSTADPEKDLVTCDGKAIKIPAKVYILLNKPKGILTTCADDRGRKTVIDIIKHIDQRIFPVGRLDFNTTGLLILTNDGEFAAKMTHPSSGVEKTYLAKVRGQVTERTLKKMLAGITLEGIRYRFKDVRREKGTSKNSYLKIKVTEGKKHLVKKLCVALGHPVSKLGRVAFGTLKLSGLEPGYYRHLSPREVSSLKAGPRPGVRTGVRRNTRPATRANTRTKTRAKTRAKKL